ncbi:MAG: signal peptidase I [Candidatus Nealsonbacteria bacterium RIFOXYB1_FULL_40_15]|uniref:Signal peptidase I n=2 Tax=Candidatus Nealsoniibacteriota TaxID=1817911 RepID=A0A1G2ELX3_9BACT|nr:MAG: signal peptidase I [Candidatus Nealsonbacteria bacterium RIFOXYC1_FULL_40_7]OGZ27577.1 MAG: signal peptidase I [Candidatus Nealsonbacteria bacterium RIFOXYB1_FULL_40_15]OGZ28298.1 MAG: signal peptidase I [Candidatus Nealsonbacteria bacterium RIFOXYD1_FULL_39_11]
MKTAIKIIYYACLGILAAIALFLMASALPITGNYKIKIVLSGSMEPTINKGSIVVIKPEERYNLGDIVNFKRGSRGETITHRIIAEEKSGYITKGDANDGPDRQEVGRADILGRVLIYIPYLGYLVSFVQKPAGFVITIIVPAAIIIGDEIKKIYEEILNKKKKKARIS